MLSFVNLASLSEFCKLVLYAYTFYISDYSKHFYGCKGIIDIRNSTHNLAH